MSLHLEKNTKEIFASIGNFAQSFGTEIYVVGGFVRDNILGIDVKDIDFTVIDNGVRFSNELAKILQAKKVVCFEKFGTCLIPHGEFKLEFVQARSEEYEPASRKPIVTKGDLKADLERRDFTINTLAYELKGQKFGELVDLFGGLDDLKSRIIKTPLDPLKTFEDDPLRMIRAIRFVSTLGFTLDDKTAEAIKIKKDRIKIVSQERITDEFVKIILSDKPSVGLDLFRTTGLLEIIYPELHKLIGVDQRGTYHHKDVWFHTLKVVDNLAAVTDSLKLRLAGLYHDIAKPQTKRFVENIGWTFHGHEVLGAKNIVQIVRRLKLSTDLIPYLQKLIKLHLRPISLSDQKVTDSAIRRLIVEAGEDLDDLLTLCRADITSGNPARVKKHLKNFDHVRDRIKQVEDIDALRAFKSPVDGVEIMSAFGLKPSPLVGKIKAMIEEAILDGIIPNERDAAFSYMLEMKDKVLSNEAKVHE